MKRHIKFCTNFIVYLAVCFLTACGRQGDAEVHSLSATETPSGEVMAAAVESAGFPLPMDPRLIGSTLYYMDGKWDNETERYRDGAVFKLPEGETEAVRLDSFEDNELMLYFVGSDGAVYSLYADMQAGTEEISLRKCNAEGERIYDVPLVDRVRNAGAVTMGQAGAGGEVCLSGPDGEIYLFDSEGHFVCKGRAPWDKSSYHGGACGMANAGKDGIFTYIVNRNTIAFRKIDLTNGKLGTIQEIRLESEGAFSVDVYDGYDSGIFFSDGDALWRYTVGQGEVSMVFRWGDETINLRDYTVDTMGMAGEALLVLAHLSPSEVYYARINRQSRAELAEKQTVTLGIVDSAGVARSELEEMVSAFNRENASYEILFETYGSMLELQEMLVKGEGPDLISLFSVDITVLADKGVLEDLSPFFAESEIVKEEDLLPSVRRAGTINDVMCCVLPDFQVNGYLVERGRTEGMAWNPGQFLDMGEENPDAALVFCTDYQDSYRSSVLGMILDADLGSYLDFGKRECSFHDGRFAAMLERIAGLDIPPVEAADIEGLLSSGQTFSDVMKEQFYQKKVLTFSVSVASLNSYQDAVAEMGETSEWVGYPNGDGIPYYEMISLTPLGINHASEAKEGAWAFLEYVLSEKYQDRNTGFPVRKDSFEKYLGRTEMFNGIVQINLSQEDRETLRSVIDHAYWMQANVSYVISPIIYEEAGAVFAGDKTPAEAAEVIQNRVWLYLQE